jgi:protein TonB
LLQLEEIMFRETLLESSPQMRKRRRWPMAAAFTLQMAAAVLLIVTPMITTGVIPLSARTVVFTPTTYQPHDAARPDSGTPGTRVSGPATTARFVPIYNNGANVIRYGTAGTSGTDDSTIPNPGIGGNGPVCPTCFGDGHGTGILPPRLEPPKRIPVSWLSEALLINKVIPEYPQHIVVQGDVKLHAIISRDGSIQSLSLISGHPLLAQAAIKAVEQWRYRPYILNGDPVEVETWITVTFKKNN